jgi:hypothetical protein
MIVPAETFAGRDLLQIELENFQTATHERKAHRARFLPTSAKVNVPAQPAAPSFTTRDAKGVSAENATSAISDVGKRSRENMTVGIVVETAEPEHAPDISQPPHNAAGDEAWIIRDEDDIGGPVENGLRVEMPSVSPSVAQLVESLPPTHGVAVHSDVRCDGCGSAAIIGDRWKCLICEEYDLCTACHTSGVVTAGHDIIHRVLRIEKPGGNPHSP